jgi:HPt (histidine-containing phosphotransfer) domain-containing protein
MSSKHSSNPSQTHLDNNEISSINTDILKQLSDIMGHEAISLMIQQFVVDSSNMIATLEDHNTQNDMNTLRRKIHQFKGESLQMGALQLGTLCENLELAIQENQPHEVITKMLVKIKTETERVNAALTQVNQND